MRPASQVVGRILGFLMGILLAVASQAEPRAVGWIEDAVLFPEEVMVKAKMDTGALTSSLDAKDIERFNRDGTHWVRFKVEVTDARTKDTVTSEFERPVLRNIKVRGAGGVDHRPVVEMSICIGDQRYEEEFSLRNRGKMLYPVLIGRRTLEHLGMVDVSRTFTLKPNCK